MDSKENKIEVPGYLKISRLITYLLYAYVIFGTVMLTFRVFFLATSANTSTGFGSFVMETSQRYLEPFRGIFPPRELSETGYLDISALFAILMYLIIVWLISALLKYIQAKIDTLVLAEEMRKQMLKEELEKERERQERAQQQVIEKTTYVRTKPNTASRTKSTSQVKTAPKKTTQK